MLGKPKNQKEQEVKRSGRVRLTWLNAPPTVKDVRLLLAEAEKNKGSLCELPMRMPMGIFLLSCQSDHLSTEPCWTLYEGEDGSKQIWSYMNEDVEMMTNIVNMSVSQGGGSSSSNVDLSALAPAEPLEPVPAAPVPLPPPAEAPDAGQPAAMDGIWGQNSSMLGSTSWGSGSAPGSTPWGAPPSAFGESSQPSAWNAGTAGTDQQPQMRNNWPQPGSQNAAPSQPEQTAPSQAPFQQQSTFQIGSQFQSGASSFQFEQPYSSQPEQPLPFAQPAGGYGDPFAGLAPTPAQTGAPAPAETGAAPKIGSASVSDFLLFLDKNQGFTIAEIAFAPNLPANCVDTAMRLQEMVCKGECDEKVARQAIKLAAQRGGRLDDSTLAEARTKAADNPDELCRKAASLLQNAGLLSEMDLAAAEGAANKDGTTYGDALLLTGKVDKLLLENAKKCYAMVNEGRIRSDQAIIALHYCQRMRSPLDDALADLSIDVL